MNSMFKLPLDAKVLGLPMAYASIAFSYMLYRVIGKDAETQNLSFYLETPEVAAKTASHYNSELYNIFKNKLKNVGLVAVFDNSGN